MIRLSEFNVPGSDLPGIEYLRDVKDADHLLESVKAAKASEGKVGGKPLERAR